MELVDMRIGRWPVKGAPNIMLCYALYNLIYFVC